MGRGRQFRGNRAHWPRQRSWHGTRGVLLASTTLAALVVPMPGERASAEPERQVAVQLGPGADDLLLESVVLQFHRSPDVFGLAPPILGIGVDAAGGDDLLTLADVSAVSAHVSERRLFGLLPGPPDLLARFLAPARTSAAAVGADLGTGNDQLLLTGSLEVQARSRLDQAEFRSTLLADQPAVLEAEVHALAVGVEGGAGADGITLSGPLTVEADSGGHRFDLGIDLIGFGALPQTLLSGALAQGAHGGSGNDRLEIASGIDVRVSARADSRTESVQWDNLRLTAPSNATVAEARAEGLAGGSGADHLENAGRLTVEASARTKEFDFALVVKDYSLPGVADPIPDPAEASRALARATGLAGGSGNDTLRNIGEIDLSAIARQELLSLTFGDGGIASSILDLIPFQPPQSPEEVAAGATAWVVGLAGDAPGSGAGHNDLLNLGRIAGTARAEADKDVVFIGLPLSEATGNPLGGASTVLDAFGIGLLDASSDALSVARGLEGGSGNDRLRNMGVVDIAAVARAATVLASASGLDAIDEGGDANDEIYSLNITLFNTGTNALALATGLAGGAGADDLENDGDIVVGADARATSLDLAFNLAMEQKSLQVEAPLFHTATWADARAIGMDGGAGSDMLANRGTIDTQASARAQQTEVAVNLLFLDTGIAAPTLLSDSRTRADATAIGMRDSGLGRGVSNSGSIAADARAETASVAVGVALGMNNAKGLSIASALLRADQDANALARGIVRDPSSNFPANELVSSGPMAATATARGNRTGVVIDVATVSTGATIAAPLIAANNSATANAIVFEEFTSGTRLESAADFRAEADAAAQSVNSATGVSITGKGVAAGASVLALRTDADATAHGFALGPGADEIVVAGRVEGIARAKADSTGVALEISGAKQGVALGATVVDGRTRAVADAAAILTGAGSDWVANEGVLAARADAIANATDVGLAFAGDSSGVAAAAALANSRTTARALSRAIDLGDGDDLLDSSGALLSAASANARGVSVNVGLAMSATGVGLAAALADTGIEARAHALGATGGDGDDLLLTSGPVLTHADARTDSAGVAVSVGLAAKGVAGAVSGLRSDARATAMAAGLAGGDGDDLVDAGGPVTVVARSDVERTDIAITAALAGKGVSAGGSLVEAEAVSEAVAVGLAGDDSFGLGDTDGDDILLNRGVLSVTAESDAKGATVSASGALVLGLAAALLDAETRSVARATGMFGGGGNDSLMNLGEMRVLADARSRGPAILLSSAGVAMGQIDSAATARAIGLDGGAGANIFGNSGLILVDARARGSALLVSVSGLSANLADTAAGADAEAIGIAGGDGPAIVESGGEVRVRGHATADGRTIQLAGLSGALGKTGTEAQARAVAIDLGAADDQLFSTGTLSASSEADVVGLQVTIAQTGLADADLASRARALATGVALGAGDNQADLRGTISADATASGRGTAASAGLIGAGLADLSTQAHAIGTGISAEGGNDAIATRSTLRVTADADVSDTAVATDLSGYSVADIGSRAIAEATGVAPGDGANMVDLLGPLIVRATGRARGTSVTATLIGAGRAETGIVARAGASGVAAGEGADRIAIAQVGSVTARADAQATLASVSITGLAQTRSATLAHAVAHGVSGGGGDDVVTLTQRLDITATANSRVTEAAATVAGGARVDGDARALAEATGLAGDNGDDWLENRNRLNVSAVSTVAADAIRVTLGGAAFGGMDVVAQAQARGLVGGDGNDTLRNTSVTFAEARAETGTRNIDVTVVGAIAANGGGGLQGLADAVALEGGAGADWIVNSGTARATATAQARQSVVGVSVAGATMFDAEQLLRAEAAAIDGGEDDDEILNNGVLDTRAVANGEASNVGVTIAGGAFGDVTVRTEAISSGIRGGAGDDLIRHRGTLTGSAISVGRRSTLGITAAGAALSGSADNLTLARAIGLDGGSGADRLVSTGSIGLTATASGRASSVNVTAAGVSAANAGSRVVAELVAISGGDGDDSIENRGAIFGTSTANGTARTLSVAGVGSAIGGNADSVARAIATAIDGGPGRNDIFSRAPVTLSATASHRAGETRAVLAGVATASAATLSHATVNGFLGGNGGAIISAFGRLDLRSLALLEAQNRIITVAGTGTAGRGDLTARADGVALAGGDGNDRLVHERGSILNLRGIADLTIASSQINVFGQAATAGLSQAIADLVGISGGAGADQLVNSGSMLVEATANQRITGSTIQILGQTTTGGEVRPLARAVGIDGGTGNDAIRSDGLTRARATSTANASNSSFQIAGRLAGGTGVGASAIATAIDTGPGQNVVQTFDRVDAFATANATLNSQSTIGIGESTANRSALSADATATGIRGGPGADEIRHNAAANVEARSRVDFDGARFTFAGVAGGATGGVARATATGIDAGNGANDVSSLGLLAAFSQPVSVGSGSARIGATGTATSAGSSTAIARSTGIETGSGADAIFIVNAVEVAAAAGAQNRTLAQSGFLFSDGRSRASAVTDNLVIGVHDRGGATDLVNTGFIRARIDPGQQSVIPGSAFAVAQSEGVTGLFGSVNSNALAEGVMTAVGIRLGAGPAHNLLNAGTVQVSLEGRVRAEARSLGINGLGNTSEARSRATSNNPRAIGIESLSGNLNLANSGDILVTARPTASASSFASGTGVPINPNDDPLAVARSVVDLANVHAIGIRLGGGFDRVVNTVNGRIIVRSAPQGANASAESRARNSDNPSVDADSLAQSYVNGTRAWGILTGNGPKEIENRGLIEARAEPTSIASAVAVGRGFRGDAVAHAQAEAMNTHAVGIQTGNANDLVVNSGTIRVVAFPFVGASAQATRGEACQTVFGIRTCRRGTQSASSSAQAAFRAVGIATGAGDDVIINSGTIEATGNLAIAGMPIDVIGTTGVAIDAGPGNDQVFLNGGRIVGDIILGTGDDYIRINRTEIAGTVNGGPGRNLIQFDGPNSLVSITGFQELLKTGSGTALVDRWVDGDRMQIDSGTLVVRASLSMGASHLLAVRIFPNGTNGTLRSQASGRQALGGALVVTTGPGAHVHGTEWNVVAATQGLSGSFRSVSLPASTALLRFSSGFGGDPLLPGFPTAYTVRVQVLPMSGMTADLGGPVQSFARALDDATPHAAGEVARTIAALQQMQGAEDVRAGVSALAPRLPQLALAATGASLDRGLDLVALRPGGPSASARAAPFGLRIAGDAPAPGAASAWAMLASSPDAVAGRARGFAAQIAGGVSMRSPGGLMAGFGFVRDRSDMALDAGLGSGQTDTAIATAHVDTAVGTLGSLSLNLAAGSGTFIGSRALADLSGTSPARLRTSAHMQALDLLARVPLPAIAETLALEAGLSLHHTTLSGARERASGGLALTIDGGRAFRAGHRLGLDWQPEARIGPIGLQTRLQAQWHYRLDAGSDRVTARFADMPDFPVRLEGDRRERHGYLLEGAIAVSDGALAGLTLSGHLASPGAISDGRAAAAVRIGLQRRF